MDLFEWCGWLILLVVLVVLFVRFVGATGGNTWRGRSTREEYERRKRDTGAR